MTIKDLIPWSWRKRGLAPLGEEDNPFFALQQQMNRMFEDFMGGFGFEPLLKGGFAPKVNVSEDRENIYISAELPGLTEKDVEVTLTGDSLTIRGEKKEEIEEKEGRNRYRAERSFGYFQRVVPLSSEINEDRIDAVFRNGVLTITLSRTAEAQKEGKKIPIRP